MHNVPIFNVTGDGRFYVVHAEDHEHMGPGEDGHWWLHSRRDILARTNRGSSAHDEHTANLQR